MEFVLEDVVFYYLGVFLEKIFYKIRQGFVYSIFCRSREVLLVSVFVFFVDLIQKIGSEKIIVREGFKQSIVKNE